VNIVCCQVEVSATDWSLVQRSPTDCGVSLCVWSRNLENEEAKARYRAVKIQPWWVVTSRKQQHVLDRPTSYFNISRPVQHHTAVLYRTQIALHPKKNHFTYLGDVEMWVMFFKVCCRIVFISDKTRCISNFFFVQIIFTFSRKDALKFKCLAPSGNC